MEKKMKNEGLIYWLQKDLQNERMHCLFYQQAAAIVRGLHREEFRELFLKEAQGELKHIDEFATLIVQLGGTPETTVAAFPKVMHPTPKELCELARFIESAVSETYAERLVQTDQSDATTSYVHLFYEDQLMDSKKTALEFGLFEELWG
jgi:bacterioferritin (cytochrome b1)